MVDAFRQSLSFHVVSWPTDKQPEEAFTSNKARGALIIPEDYGRNIARGEDATVQILVDASDENTAQIISGDARADRSRVQRGKRAEPLRPQPVNAAIRLWYNPSRSSQKFYGPGIYVLAMSLFPPLLATLAMSREGEQKTILQVYVSNISAHEFLLGKIAAFMVVATAEASIMMMILFTGFGLRFAGDPTPFHRRHDSVHVLRDDLWKHDRRGDSQPGGRDAGGGARRISAGVHAFRLAFSDSKYSRRHSLDFQLRLGPLLHRNCARRPAGGRRLAVGVAKGARHRRNRRDFLRHRVAQYAAHAVEGLTMNMHSQHFSATACGP